MAGEINTKIRGHFACTDYYGKLLGKYSLGTTT